MNFDRIYEAAKSSFTGKTTRPKIDTSFADKIVKKIVRKGIVDSTDIERFLDFVRKNDSMIPAQKKVADEIVSILSDTPLDIQYLAYRWNQF